MNPFLRLVCLMQLANVIHLLIKVHYIVTGHWVHTSATWFSLAITMFMFFGLIRVQRMAASRIKAIAVTADHIVHTGDLSQRITDPYGGTEELSLIAVLNRMLDQIELNIQAVRTVSDNIAHDLRHPLTRLRNHIEELRPDADPAAKQQKISDLVTECDALLGTFQAILRISNIESARRHGVFCEVDIHHLLQDVVELYEPLAAEKKITITLNADTARTTGDKDLLFQAFANLLDNAIKYTPASGHIAIIARTEGAGVMMTIADSGPGVADNHKPNIFRRFYRADASRSTPGTGLGLSLVQAIIHLHQGTIMLSDTVPHGLTVTVRL